MRLLSRVHKTIPARSGVGLVIMPTYDCNFRCPYCFEQHRLKNGEAWLANAMSDETMDAIFAALDDYKARGYALGDCTLYGRRALPRKEPGGGAAHRRELQGARHENGRHHQRLRA